MGAPLGWVHRARYRFEVSRKLDSGTSRHDDCFAAFIAKRHSDYVGRRIANHIDASAGEIVACQADWAFAVANHVAGQLSGWLMAKV